jgi:hypothetical protein
MATQTQYQTNDLTALKREALLAKDIETLANIVGFQKDNRNRVYYFKRAGEDCIRTSEGLDVDLESLGIAFHKAWEVFWPFEFWYLLESHKSKPGSLIRDITDKPSYRDLSRIILEIPDDLAFPIPEDFDWMATSREYLTNNPEPTERRLDGHKFYKILHHIKGRPYSPGLTLISVENLTQEQIEAIVEQSNTQDNETSQNPYGIPVK